ncbi:hypothetical protein MMC13_001872, partial [Lambiella insularis]|nr:hypothetical protein [Lambiella insularis]
VYDFLWTFPPHEDIMTSVCHGGTDTVLVFSPDAPYKTLYAVYTLNFCLSKQLRD